MAKLSQRIETLLENSPSIYPESAILLDSFNQNLLQEEIVKGDFEGEGTPCNELYRLYKFRLEGQKNEVLRNQIEYLLANLSRLNGERCYLVSLTDGSYRYVVFFNKQLDSVLGCIMHEEK